MVEVKNLGKRFGHRWLFRGLNFDLSAGQSLAVLGKNGSGKSTLLKLIASLLPPSEGAVRYDFHELRTELGYSALDMALYPQMTVREHLVFCGKVRGCPDRCDELLEIVGLGYAESTAAAKLSSGMKARLKLGMALQPKPKLLILDEPGASLDEDGRELIAEISRRQLEAGCLIIATNEPHERTHATHELHLAV